MIEQMTCERGLTLYQRVNYFAEKSKDEKKSSCKQSERRMREGDRTRGEIKR